MLLIPTIAAMVFGGLSISRALSAQAEARQAETVAQALPDTYNLAINILFERDGALGGVPDIVMRPLQQKTDESIEAWSAKAKEIDAGEDKDLENSIVEIQQALNGIDDLRSQIQQKDTQVEAQLAYTTVMNNLFGISAQMPTLENDEVFSKISAIGNVRPASEAMGTERVIMMKALSAKAIAQKNGKSTEDILKDEEFAELARAEAKWRLSTADYYVKTSDEIRQMLDELTNETTEQGSIGAPAHRVVNQVISSGSIERVKMTPDEYTEVSTQYIRGLQKMIVATAQEISDDVEQIKQDATRDAIIIGILVLGVLIFALAVGLVAARSILSPLSQLRRLAYNLANHDLPERVAYMNQAEGPVDTHVEPLDIARRDEIGDVADAFDAVHVEAIRLAGEQAELRTNVDKMFMNLSRRSQSLVERQLQLIDQLEANEQDPDDLANLFRLDHLATRMRRNDESLLVLAGGEIGHAARGPVPVLDVLRAAASEIEQFARVDIDSEENAEFEGAIAGDLVHLLAELIENATNFSPPDTAVTIRTFRAGPAAPLLVEIEDLGIGMTPEELDAANMKLRRATGLDADVARMMGLVVVARLAARHGLYIELVPNRPRGVVARVEMPVTTIVGAHAEAPAEQQQGFDAYAFQGGYGQQTGGYPTTGELPYEMQYGMPAYDAQPYAGGNPYDVPVGALPAPEAPAASAAAPPALPSRTPGASNHPNLANNGTGTFQQQGANGQSGQHNGFGQTGPHTGQQPAYGAVPPMPGDPGFEGPTSRTGSFPAQPQQFSGGQPQYGGDPFGGGQQPAQPPQQPAQSSGPQQNFLSNMLPVRKAEDLAARFPDGRFDPNTESGDLPRRDPGAQGGSPFGTDTGAFRTFERPNERTTPRTPPPGFGPDDDPFGPAGDAIAPGPMGPMAPEPTDSPNPLDSTTEVPILDDEGSSIFDDLQSEWFTRRRPLGARRAMEAKGDPLSDPLAAPNARAGKAPKPDAAPAPSGAEQQAEEQPAQDDEPTTPVSWSSPGDEGWRRAQELEQLQEQEPATVTQGGLPVRVPGQNLIPGAAPAVTPPTSGPRNMDARRTRGMSSFQKGVSRARNNPAEAESNPEGEEQQ
ncbi:signal transduction histidine kinase [Nocardioides luteus]|uniref:HAMP domain-containing sensor histidine kinase n=1 Tax=Nocardioides luteus TaxID=1844 RepID=UPI00166706F7|nr:HAMP domain-containing sensor histidine kinase [Nocardioides luteus]MDR7312151.1 signal transduction histidine kinase [Nocardioides luteus]